MMNSEDESKKVPRFESYKLKIHILLAKPENGLYLDLKRAWKIKSYPELLSSNLEPQNPNPLKLRL